MPYGITCIYIPEWSGQHCGKPADFEALRTGSGGNLVE
jgi:hypothetical protein